MLQKIDHDLFPVVGIGASAGGLEAVTALLRSMSSDPGMAFVLVQHLDPHHSSALADILSKTTSMEVREVVEGMAVCRNQVYVITPGTEIIIEGGRLRITPRPTTRTPQSPIDLFFTSLAADCGPRAVGVVLSGTGSDGTRGLQAIKGADGITFAQDATAAHNGMPRSAIAAGCVDFVLSPDRIAAELLRTPTRLTPVPLVFEMPEESVLGTPDEQQIFQQILKLLSKRSGIDFTQYKYPTLHRRIARRMIIRRLQTLNDYYQCLSTDGSELDTLQDEILIQVTSFFRDPDVFEELKNTVLPQIVADRPVDSPIRIWVPGCSSGEEVYSHVMSLLEFLEASNSSLEVKAFATDVSEPAIEKARAGVYPESISSDVSPERLARFFIRSEGGYQVNKAVRDACVFARQDVTRDPPFSQLDLISCRNVLIYLGNTLQTRVFPMFHYALKPGGFLILGSAETVGTFADLFQPFDKQRHFYRRTAVPTRLTSSFVAGTLPAARTISFPETHELANRMNEVQHEADRLILERYAPCGVIVNEFLEVVQFRGRTGEFLEPAPGRPTNDVLRMVREGLLPSLRIAIDEAKSSGLVSRQDNVQFHTSDGESVVDLQVVPLTLPSSGQRYFIILFEATGPSSESTQPRHAKSVSTATATENEQELMRLKQELSATKSYLQSVIEGKNFTNEELRAANEEIISSNEELQSTNEELETAKEELQATNEEVETVNEELHSRIVTATQLNDDLMNLIDSVRIPIVIVGHDLRIRRFASSAAQAFNLIPGDVGRLITDLKMRINVSDLKSMIVRAIDSLGTQECEVKDEDGRWYSLSIRPYRTIDNRIDGAVILLFDVNAIKQREQQIIVARDFAQKVIETLHESLLFLDERLRVEQANRTFYETFQTSPQVTEGQLIYALGNSQWNIPELRSLLEELLITKEEIRDFRIERDFATIGRRTMLLNARYLRDQAEGQPVKVLLAIQDITAIEETLRSLKSTEDLMQTIIDTAATGIITMDETGIVQSFNRAAESIFGYTAPEVVGKNVRMLMPDPYQSAHDGYLKRYLETGDKRVIGRGRVVLAQRRDGTTFPADLAVSEIAGPKGRLFTGCLLDISQRRELEREVLEVANHEQLRIGQHLHDVTGQELAGLGYLAQSLVGTLQAKSAPEAGVANRIAQGLETALGQVRSIARGLVPVDVTAEGLRTALQVHVEKTSAVTGIPCRFDCKPTVLVKNTQVATQLFFIACEAITNAVKHARPTTIEVKLEVVDHLLVLEIRDDGIGIPESGQANGIGLRIMAYRAGLLNGMLNMGRNSPSGGTVITCRIPLDEG